jgi:hypothetical protein
LPRAEDSRSLLKFVFRFGTSLEPLPVVKEVLFMRTPKRALAILASVGLLAASSAIYAQQGDQQQRPQEPAQQQRPQESTAQGTLLSVNMTAKTITIRSSSGTEMLFTYTDQTKVTGGEDSVAGLASKANSSVTVHYTKQGASNVATSIEVAPKS